MANVISGKYLHKSVRTSKDASTLSTPSQGKCNNLLKTRRPLGDLKIKQAVKVR